MARRVERLAIVWESLGPSHRDRIAAAAAAGFAVTGIGFGRDSAVYRWEAGEAAGARQEVLAEGPPPQGQWQLGWRLAMALWRGRYDAVFLCHYHLPAVFALAVVLRLAGRRVFTMIDSKFDDAPRRLRRELVKRALLLPYHGALAGSLRTAAYLHLLGFARRPVACGYDSLSLARLRALADGAPEPPHGARDFLIVARLVPKKNLAFALRAFATQQPGARYPRRLRIIGEGPEEPALRQLAARLGVQDRVDFAGWLDAAEIARAMRAALCLILPSKEEQYGLVVGEALAQGLPVLVSARAGAVEGLIDNGCNGWIIDPVRPQALIAAMARLDRDRAAWQAVRQAAWHSAQRGDVQVFVAALRTLLRRTGG